MSINKLNNNFNIELDKEIQKLKSKNKNVEYLKNKFRDLSYLKTYTIDDIDTLEVDDAISLERISNNYKLWIHIASPASYIDYDSEFDKNARKLISSVYLSNNKNNIYMFPESLIENIFSLTDKEKRLSISLGIILNNDGSVLFSEIVQSLIKPNYRLSYSEADELIDYAPKEEQDLSIISNILQKRNEWRKKSGAIEIIESYGKIIVNDSIPFVKVIDPTLSRLLIREAMILYGDLISDYTQRNNIPVPYRVQENIGNLPKYNNNLDNRILFNFELKKSMGKTYYSSNPMRHNSLGLNSYLQASSPIRRYSDLLVNYQLIRFLNHKILITKDEIDKNINEINYLAKQNINRYREDQKIWFNKFFENNSSNEYRVILLNWINRYKNICIIYFVEYYISSICYLKVKSEIKTDNYINVKNITNDYSDILRLELIL